MKISRQVGTVSEVLSVFIQDATVSTGAGLANVSSALVSYSFCRNNQTSISSGTCSTSTGALGLYFVSTLTQASSTSSLGWYQFCPPDALFASGTSAFLHLYGAANMAPVPMEVELTKTNNQQYASSTVYSSTNIVAAVTAPVGVSTITVGVNASTVSGLVGVSTVTIPVGVSSLSVGVNASTVSGLVGVSSVTIPVGVSSISIPVGVSSGTWLAGVSSVTIPVGVSSISIPVGVSSGTWLAGVSTLTAAVTAAIADRYLGRNVSSGADGGRTVSEAMYVLRNKVDVSAGIVYATDDAATAWSFTVSTSAGDPIVSIDPV